jgi:hypothetical protein
MHENKVRRKNTIGCLSREPLSRQSRLLRAGRYLYDVWGYVDAWAKIAEQMNLPIPCSVLGSNKFSFNPRRLTEDVFTAKGVV